MHLRNLVLVVALSTTPVAQAEVATLPHLLEEFALQSEQTVAAICEATLLKAASDTAKTDSSTKHDQVIRGLLLGSHTWIAHSTKLGTSGATLFAWSSKVFKQQSVSDAHLSYCVDGAKTLYAQMRPARQALLQEAATQSLHELIK